MQNRKKRGVIVATIVILLITIVLSFLHSPYKFLNNISVTFLRIIPSLLPFALFLAFNKKKREEEAEKRLRYIDN